MVAENFGKQHKHVLEAIKNLMAENSATKNYFYKTTYTSRGKEYPMYLMNKKGFMLLVMGFNGSKAIETKMTFLDKFEQMENELRNLKMQLNVPSYQIENPIERAKAWIVEEEERQKLQLEVKENKELLIEQAPKVQALDAITGDTVKLYTITQIAANYGMSGIKMNAYLKSWAFNITVAGIGSYTPSTKAKATLLHLRDKLPTVTRTKA